MLLPSKSKQPLHPPHHRGQSQKVQVCSDVGKERDIIRNPHLLQLPRTVSRALGRVIEDSPVEVPDFPTIKCARKMSWRRKGGRAAADENFVAGRRRPFDQSRADYLRAKAQPPIKNVSWSYAATRPTAIAQSLTMLRQHMLRSLKRPAHRAALNGCRAFTASARRPADIELTIGLCALSQLRAAAGC